MRAAIFRKGEIVADTLPEPEPRDGQVLVKTLACGICGSDLHARKHASRMAEVNRRSGRAAFNPERDMVFGHEYCCEIIEHGPNTEKTFKVGTRVCSIPALMSPKGAKSIGYSNSLIGGYAERMLLSEQFLLEVPNGLSAEHAALTEPLAVGIHAVEKANVRGDEVPLVIGCGPVGLAVIAALKMKGLRPIIAADYSPARRALAQTLGADVVIDPAQVSPFTTWTECAAMAPEEIAAKPPGRTWTAALKPALKPALMFECVGVPGVIQQIFQGAPRDARIVVVGVCMETDTVEPMMGITKELNVQFVLGYTPQEFASALRLIAEGEVPASSLITGKVGIDGVAQAFEDLANPERHTKILVEPWR